MSRSVKTGIAGFVAGLTALLLGLFVTRPAETVVSVLEANGTQRWYRGNLHTHSLWSDGDDYPEMIALWYLQHGYDFLCFTDHNVLPDVERWTDVDKNPGKRLAYLKLKARFPGEWVEERATGKRLEVRLKRFTEVVDKVGVPGKFLLIQGEELTDHIGKVPFHLNATNLQQLIPPQGGATVYEALQSNVDAVLAQRAATGAPILVHLNHPNFGWGVTAEDLMRVRGENYFEVYNGHPGAANSGDAEHASTERFWDIVLTRRITELGLPLMYGLATDDSHQYHDTTGRRSAPGRGWVQVLATELSPQALIAALEAGHFYASSGVKLNKVLVTSQSLEVEVAADPKTTYTIEFIGTRKGFDPKEQEVVDKTGKPVNATHRYSDDIGQTFETVVGTKAAYELRSDDLYVRARVTSSKKHPNPGVAKVYPTNEPEYERAWVQPMLGPAAPVRQ